MMLSFDAAGGGTKRYGARTRKYAYDIGWKDKKKDSGCIMILVADAVVGRDQAVWGVTFAYI